MFSGHLTITITVTASSTYLVCTATMIVGYKVYSPPQLRSTRWCGRTLQGWAGLWLSGEWSWANVIKLFSSLLMKRPDKIECLSLTNKEFGWDKILVGLFNLVSFYLIFIVLIKILRSLHLKQSSFLLSADDKPMWNGLVHAMPWVVHVCYLCVYTTISNACRHSDMV